MFYHIWQQAEAVMEVCLYLWFLAHLQVGTHRMEGSGPTHIEMGLVERLQHLDKIWALPLIAAETENKWFRMSSEPLMQNYDINIYIEYSPTHLHPDTNTVHA